MKRMSTFLVLGCLTIVLAALAACGGGSDGGGDAFVPVAYTGVTTPATIDGTNAADLAALAESGTSYGMLAPDYVLAGTEQRTAIPALQTLIDFGQQLPDYLQTLQGGSADLAAAAPRTCSFGGSADVVQTWTGTPASNDGVLTSDISFANCDEGTGVVFNGRVSLVLTGITVDSAGAPDLNATTQFAMSQTYWNLQASFQDPVNDAITFYAVMNFSFAESGGYPMITMTIPTMVMVQSSTGQTAQVKNYLSRVIEYPGFDEIILASPAAMAEIYDHDLGFVFVYTDPGSPILEDTDPLTITTGPYAGIVRMEGANNSSAAVNFSVTCDAVTNNGSYSDGTTSGEFCYVPMP